LIASSVQWFIVWIFLEINTLSICFLFSKDLSKGKLKLIFVVIYYSVQVFSSLLILISVIKCEFLLFQNSDFLLLIGVLIKMGLWPFHSWYLKIIYRLEINFDSLWIMITWQKLLPLFIILFSTLLHVESFLLVLVILNLILSLIYLKNVLNIKSVLGFSSINSNRWLIILVFFSIIIWKLFLLVYSLRIISIIYFVNREGTRRIRNLVILLALVFNIGGLPPILMFWAKVLTIKTILCNNIQDEIVFLLLIRTCYIVFFYLYIILLEFFYISLKR